MKKTMKAAVVREFGKPLNGRGCANPPAGPRPGACEGPGVRRVWDRSACGPRRLAGQAEPSRSFRAMRAWGTWRPSAPA